MKKRLILSVRNIPACTGKTSLAVDKMQALTEHPRLHGENGPVSKALRRCGGTSPPARGKQLYALKPTFARRNIPACTGKTYRIAHGWPAHPEHPRLHGENLCRSCLCPRNVGTSPPARGKRLLHQSCTNPPRNIPACTGKTSVCSKTRRWPTEHPRLHGENQALIVAQVIRAGTSPPARGKLGKAAWDIGAHRNIPACTGKTGQRIARTRYTTEHPRLHGENCDILPRRHQIGGTSPPARGKHFGATSPSPVYTLRGLRKPS